MRGSYILGGLFLRFGLQHVAGQASCPITVPTPVLTVDDVNLDCVASDGTVFLRQVTVTIPSEFVTGDGTAAEISFAIQSDYNGLDNGGQGMLTIGEDIIIEEVPIVAGPLTLIFDGNLCSDVTLTLVVDDGTCPFLDCPQGAFEFDESNVETAVDDVCRGDGSEVGIPGGSIAVAFANVDVTYNIAQGSISVDSPSGWTVADDISVDLVPNIEATITAFLATSGGEQCMTAFTFTPACDPLCPNGEAVCDDPHMQGLRGQRIDWSGVDGGWYALIHGDDVSINVRLTAPLPDDFPDRQLVTGLSVLSQGHALIVEVKNPYDIATDGCPDGVSPCLADGGLRIIVDEEKVENTLLLRTSSRELPVADGAFLLSASNLPVECRQFGGDKIWARMYEEWMHGTRDLASGDISFEAWLTSFDRMAAPDWCVKYIAENDLVDLQSTHAIFKIETSTGVTVRLNAGVNFQGGGERDWDERVLPDLEFWQMGVGVDGLDIEDPALSGILGETARPVFDDNGKAVMEGFEAFRGIVEDYRVSSALGSQFALLDTAEERYE